MFNLCPSVRPSVCLSVSFCFSVFHALSVCLLSDFCLRVCFSVCMSVCLFVCFSVCLSACLFLCLSVCLSVCPFPPLSVPLSVILSLSLFLFYPRGSSARHLASISIHCAPVPPSWRRYKSYLLLPVFFFWGGG